MTNATRRRKPDRSGNPHLSDARSKATRSKSRWAGSRNFRAAICRRRAALDSQRRPGRRRPKLFETLVQGSHAAQRLGRGARSGAAAPHPPAHRSASRRTARAAVGTAAGRARRCLPRRPTRRSRATCPSRCRGAARSKSARSACWWSISNPDDLKEKYDLPQADVALERKALEDAFANVDKT